MERRDLPECAQGALYERGVYLRGLFIQRYAAVELAVTQLLMMCGRDPAYRALGDVPQRMDDRLRRIETILRMDGPVAAFAERLWPSIEMFMGLEEDRHLLFHGLMSTGFDDGGQRVLSFRLYEQRGRTPRLRALDMPAARLESLATLLEPVAWQFTALVATIGRHLNPPKASARGTPAPLPAPTAAVESHYVN